MSDLVLVTIIGASLCVNLLLVVVYLKRKKAPAPTPAPAPEQQAQPAVAAEPLVDEVVAETPEEDSDGFDAENLAYGKLIAHKSHKAGPLTGKQVLAVDDTPENLEVLLNMLDLMGLGDYCLANNGAQAIEVAERIGVDIIFMDIQMPVMNGLDASENIKTLANHRDTPIVPITAHSRVVTEEVCAESGMTGFLRKPVDMAQLRVTTERVLMQDYQIAV